MSSRGRPGLACLGCEEVGRYMACSVREAARAQRGVGNIFGVEYLHFVI